MDNTEKNKIIKKLCDLVKSRSLLDIPVDYQDYEYLVEMLHRRLIVLKPETPAKYIWPFYIEHGHMIQFVFPTPPYADVMDADMRKILEKFIAETRKCIAEIIAKQPQKIVLDLRNNSGGYLYVFYDALLPLLPPRDGLLATGVDRNGNDYMRFTNKNNTMILAFNEGQETRKLTPVMFRPVCPIELWVNSRSASSSEMMALLCSQDGYEVIGGPMMGLTTGMTSIKIENASVSIPVYFFKDVNGKIYQPPDSKVKINKTGKEVKGAIGDNVLTTLPKQVMKWVESKPSIPLFNNIICKYFDNNYHTGINYDKPAISYAMQNDQLYIHIPKKCTTKISAVLDEFDAQLKSGTSVLIDIRNAELGAEDQNFLEIFDGLYRPWNIELIETTHSQDDDHDVKYNRLDEKNLIGHYAYIANKRPYTFSEKQPEIGKYSDISAKFWVNKHSMFGTISSCLFLLYVKAHFGLFEESTLAPYYDYGMYRYQISNIKAYVYSDKFLDESK